MAMLQCVTVCCSVLQCLAVSCSVLHCLAVSCSVHAGNELTLSLVLHTLQSTCITVEDSEFLAHLNTQRMTIVLIFFLQIV